ncbi:MULTISPECIES: hypothetical protein [Deefgea]|uniref:DUF5064 family protein n=1 Tax=Deefgea chitinilytica TaxID=570276 RepID=A0ABS2CD34_9NEIS|nr:MULTISPECIES: hypothetical protein [Deefgea]MBM5571585.1 hypothetical protein [Deefgea chitinilytica]MBM9888820.1 hypothetical protein [Deefgea sp. CFH1-16]
MITPKHQHLYEVNIDGELFICLYEEGIEGKSVPRFVFDLDAKHGRFEVLDFMTNAEDIVRELGHAFDYYDKPFQAVVFIRILEKYLRGKDMTVAEYRTKIHGIINRFFGVANFAKEQE